MSGATVRVGQRVRFPWGFNTVEGTIVEVFGPPGRRLVRVTVELPDLDDIADAPVIALPAQTVEAATAA